MDRRIDLTNIDLDVAVQAVNARAGSWRSAGLEVGDLTWMDNDASSPVGFVHRSATTRPRSVGWWIIPAVLVIASLAGCSDVHVAVNQPMLKRVDARLNDERTFLSELGPKSGAAGAVTLVKCSKTDGFVVQQPSLERRWEVPEGQAADVVRSLQSRAEARGWRDDSAGSEIVRLRKQVHGDSLVLEITSEGDGGGSSNISLDLYLSNLSPCS